MNKYNRAAINNFLATPNVNYLCSKLEALYPQAYIRDYLSRTILTHLNNYGQVIERRFLVTEISNRIYRSQEQDIAFQVGCLNMEFLSYLKDFIKLNIEKTRIPNSPITYVNDALPVGARSVVDNCPTSRLCDTNTRDVDDPAYVFSDKKSPSAELGTRQRFQGDNSDANKHLSRTWYAYRPQQIRDDPPGEVVRDQDPRNKQISHGNASESMVLNPHNHMSDRMVEGFDARRFVPADVSNLDPAFKNARMRSANTTQHVFHNVQTNVSNMQHLHNAEYGNVAFATESSYSGAPDTLEAGSYCNKFTGDDAEYSGGHVDRLLTTAKIQHLNSGSACDDCTDSTDIFENSTISMKSGDGVLRTAMQKGYQKSPDVTVRGLQQTEDPQALKLWTDGDGFVDDTNAKCMEEYMNRRVFRSMNPGKSSCSACNMGTCKVHSLAERIMNTKKTDDAAGQIPFYEVALYQRNYERNVDEAVGGFETTGLQRGYGKDIISQRCRIPNKYPCGDDRYAQNYSGGIMHDVPPHNPDWSAVGM